MPIALFFKNLNTWASLILDLDGEIWVWVFDEVVGALSHEVEPLAVERRVMGITDHGAPPTACLLRTLPLAEGALAERK